MSNICDNATPDPHVLHTPHLEVRCEPRCGGRISHFIPAGTDANQFHWNPPGMDLRQLSKYAPIGGWKEMAVTADCSFPGMHWNQRFSFERLDAGNAPGTRMACDAGGLRLTRTVTLDADRASMTIDVRCTNIAETVQAGVRIQTQPILTPGGTLHADSVVTLLPGANDVVARTLTVPELQPGRIGAVEFAPHTNWWACADPDAGVTLVIEDETGETALHNLSHDPHLLILHNFGPTIDLPPGESLHMRLRLHYYAFDLAPLVTHLGASRYLADREQIIGVKLSETELAHGQDSLSADAACISLNDRPPVQTGEIVLRGQAAREPVPVTLHIGENTRLSTGQATLDSAALPLGDYDAALTVDDESAVASRFSVVKETRRQKRDAARRATATRLEQLTVGVDGLPAAGFTADLVRQDLKVAQDLLEQDATDVACLYLDFVEDALSAGTFDAPLSFPHPKDLHVDKKWVRELEKALPKLPGASRAPEHYGSAHCGEFLHGWHWRTDSRIAYALAWLAFHPDSRYHEDEATLCRAALLVDSICRAFADGTLPSEIARDRNVDRFTLGPLGEAMRILLALPIANSRKEFWKARFREAVEYQIETYGGQSIPEGGYLNQDVMYLLANRFAHEFFGEERYREQCDYILDMMESHLLPDGAFYYIYPHNEVPGYHQINVAYLFRDFCISGDARSKKLVEDTVRYYPLTVGPGGWTEPYTQTWWKHIPGVRWPSLGPALVAGVTGDAQNQYISRQAPDVQITLHGLEHLMYTALGARDDVPEEAPPDRFMVLDRNVGGPRGRSDAFGWAGTTSPYRDTFVGATFGRNEEDIVHLMHYAGPQVFFSALPETNPHRNGVGLAMSPQAYPSDVVIGDDAAALTVQYGLYQYQQRIDHPPPSDWLATQLWYFDRERLVGLMVLEAQCETAAQGIDLSTRFACHKNGQAQTSTPLEPTGPDAYQCGPLHLRVLEYNLDRTLVEDTWVCTYTGDTPGKGLFARQPSDAGLFAKGARFHLLVEVRPESSQPADIARVDGGVGFHVAAGKTKHTVCMTEKEHAIACSLD